MIAPFVPTLVKMSSDFAINRHHFAKANTASTSEFESV